MVGRVACRKLAGFRIHASFNIILSTKPLCPGFSIACIILIPPLRPSRQVVTTRTLLLTSSVASTLPIPRVRKWTKDNCADHAVLSRSQDVRLGVTLMPINQSRMALLQECRAIAEARKARSRPIDLFRCT